MASNRPQPLFVATPPPQVPGEDADDYDDDREESPPRRSTGSRLFAVTSSLLRVHYEIAEREVAADQKRFVRGLVCFGLAFFMLLLTLLVAQALLVFWLRQLGFGFMAALGMTAAADALGGLLCLWLGRSSLKAPVLPQTRALLRRTMSALLSS